MKGKIHRTFKTWFKTVNRPQTKTTIRDVGRQPPVKQRLDWREVGSRLRSARPASCDIMMVGQVGPYSTDGVGLGFAELRSLVG
jgi:hypothetical protein